MITEPLTILIVDDDTLNRKLLDTMLKLAGYRTVHAASGEGALALVHASAPDLILLDVMMPGMDGNEVTRRLKKNPLTSNIPVIMVTAQIDRAARITGLDAGAEDFLMKPVERAELWLRVRNLLRLKSYSDYLKNHTEILEQEVRARTADLQRFRTAMDATADGIMLISRRTMCFIEVNATACSMFRYTSAELMQIGPQHLGAGTYDECCTAYDELIASNGANVLASNILTRRDGSSFQAEVHRQVQQTGDDWVIVAVVRDITERKLAESRLHHLAHFDALTGLPNRALFYETLQNTLHHARKNSAQVAVLFIDLDHFKNINDTLGHACGDELLTQFGERLKLATRQRDTVGRLGGDEFAVILVMPGDTHVAGVVAMKIKDRLRAPFLLKGHEVFATASIGIALSPDDASDHDTLIGYADTAMYRAKVAGRDTFRFFTAQMNIDMMARLEMEKALRKAIEHGEFVLHYQPKVQVDSGEVVGVEALLRWQRPELGLISPQQFIPVLEETAMILPVGTWVIESACAQIRRWIDAKIPPLQISVNVAGRQFVEGDVFGDVTRALAKHQIPASLLELELTESSLMANTESTIESMRRLKELGVQISIDDFGTGFSSLAYLCRFPIDKLKIDIAFVRNITTNPDDATIVRTIIQMAHSLQLHVIAEGVEKLAQLDYLREHGCDQIQGYYFSRPLPALELQQLIREKKCLPLAVA